MKTKRKRKENQQGELNGTTTTYFFLSGLEEPFERLGDRAGTPYCGGG